MGEEVTVGGLTHAIYVFHVSFPSIPFPNDPRYLPENREDVVRKEVVARKRNVGFEQTTVGDPLE